MTEPNSKNDDHDHGLVVGETRIRDVDGFCGTVVYVGPVASAKNQSETYAGIMWDDASRGKHDGSVICRRTNSIVRHFHCGPTQGSFLRLSKLDRGVTLDSKLLRSKYVELEAPVVAPNNILPHTARTSSGRDKAIEFLGELKIRERQQLKDLDKVSLRREGVSRASSSEEDLSEFHQIKDIDLAGNLLSNWKDVWAIIQQFPNLMNLSLAYNRIRDVTIPTQNLSRFRILNLNNCSISNFSTLDWIEASMPNLEELCIAGADLSGIQDQSLNKLQQLQILDCSNCQLSSWDTITKVFGGLSKLEQLSLDNNPIEQIRVPETNKDKFQSLKAIQLAGTSLSSWSDIEALNSLKLLASLRLKNTPLTSKMGQGEVRAITVARIPALEYLNGSVISSQERTEAERRYLSLALRLIAQAKANQENQNDGPTEEDVRADHPRLTELREKYKEMVISTLGPGGGSSLAASVCNVTIISMASSSCSMEPLQRRLPGSLQIGRLKALCARSFGLDVDCMTLHFRTKVRRTVLCVSTYLYSFRPNPLSLLC
jgi:tubulin-specific chaperone E